MRLRQLANCLNASQRKQGITLSTLKAAQIYLDHGFEDKAREAISQTLKMIGEAK